MRIRGAKGLGDACYVYPIVKYYAKRGDKVEIMTRYPVIYEVLIREFPNVSCIDRYGGKPDIDCRYGPRYSNQETNMWEDTLIQAGLIAEKNKIPFEIKYKWSEEFKFSVLKRICLIKTPCFPTGKPSHTTKDLIPDIGIYQKIIDKFKDDCCFVMSGLKNEFVFVLNGIDEDLSHIDKIPRLMALIRGADIVLTQSSYFVSIAEGMDTRCLVCFAQTGLSSRESYYRWSTPAKVITKPETSDAFIDSEPIEKIFRKFERLLNK